MYTGDEFYDDDITSGPVDEIDPEALEPCDHCGAPLGFDDPHLGEHGEKYHGRCCPAIECREARDVARMREDLARDADEAFRVRQIAVMIKAATVVYNGANGNYELRIGFDERADRDDLACLVRALRGGED